MSNAGKERERRIRERAYFLWLKEGRPEGRSIEFWERARALEREAAREAEESRIDAEGRDSFPASDPPSHTGITGERRDEC
jgi:hypothetical protein